MNAERITKLTKMVEYAEAEMNHCIEQDNPFDGSYWYQQIKGYLEEIDKLKKEAV